MYNPHRRKRARYIKPVTAAPEPPTDKPTAPEPPTDKPVAAPPKCSPPPRPPPRPPPHPPPRPPPRQRAPPPPPPRLQVTECIRTAAIKLPTLQTAHSRPSDSSEDSSSQTSQQTNSSLSTSDVAAAAPSSSGSEDSQPRHGATESVAETVVTEWCDKPLLNEIAEIEASRRIYHCTALELLDALSTSLPAGTDQSMVALADRIRAHLPGGNTLHTGKPLVVRTMWGDRFVFVVVLGTDIVSPCILSELLGVQTPPTVEADANLVLYILKEGLSDRVTYARLDGTVSASDGLHSKATLLVCRYNGDIATTVTKSGRHKTPRLAAPVTDKTDSLQQPTDQYTVIESAMVGLMVPSHWQDLRSRTKPELVELYPVVWAVLAGVHDARLDDAESIQSAFRQLLSGDVPAVTRMSEHNKQVFLNSRRNNGDDKFSMRRYCQGKVYGSGSATSGWSPGRLVRTVLDNIEFHKANKPLLVLPATTE